MKTLQIALLSILAFALIALAQTGPGTSNYPVKNGSSASFSSVTITPKCAATGTTSVNCGANTAGFFSCSTSGPGTCAVTASAATAGSVIVAQLTNTPPPGSGLTCSANYSTNPVTLINSQASGTFSVNLPTWTTGVACYQYVIF